MERFAKKITETYGRDGNPVVIFYGDWGRRPNLKNQAPTPGIGLRRLLHASKRILTITVRESYTSSFCPCCSSEVDNARGAHGLLKCTGGRDQCGMYWSRDVLGASNILAKADYLMQHPGTRRGWIHDRRGAQLRYCPRFLIMSQFQSCGNACVIVSVVNQHGQNLCCHSESKHPFHPHEAPPPSENKVRSYGLVILRGPIQFRTSIHVPPGPLATRHPG